MSVRFWERGRKVRTHEIQLTPAAREHIHQQWAIALPPDAVATVEIWEDDNFVYLVSFPPKEVLALEGDFSHAGDPECHMVHTKREWDSRNRHLADGRHVPAQLLMQGHHRAIELNRRAGNLGFPEQ